MLKSERRSRSLSFSYTAYQGESTAQGTAHVSGAIIVPCCSVAPGRCRHPQVRPLGLAEAEQLLRNAPLKEEPAPLTEEGETMEEYLDATNPKLPTSNSKLEEKKVRWKLKESGGLYHEVYH